MYWESDLEAGRRQRRQTSRCIQEAVDFYKNANKSANNSAEAKKNDKKSR